MHGVNPPIQTLGGQAGFSFSLPPEQRAAAAVSPCFYPDMPSEVRVATLDLAIAIAGMATIDVYLAGVSAHLRS